jgi:hypothetical protein
MDRVIRAIWVAFAGALLALVGTNNAQAFDLGNHESITRECVQVAGDRTLQDIADELSDSVKTVDWRDSLREASWLYAGGKIKVGSNYQPQYHCDRAAGQGHMAAFRACQTYFADTFKYSLSLATQGNRKDAIKEIGRWMHVLEDAYSHGNAAWETATDPIRACFAQPELTCNVPPDQGPGAGDNAWKYFLVSFPGDDGRSHGKFAADSSNSSTLARSTGSCTTDCRKTPCSRFQCSFVAAVQTCRAAASKFLEKCDANCRKTLKKH